MHAADIAALVTESASRFGFRNPQQFQQLESRLRKVPEAEVAQGLLRVFTDGAAPPEGSPAQELAGQLLAALRPRSEVSLRSVLQNSLPRYELSVEQLPQYFGWLFGATQVLAAIQELERERVSPEDLRALQTMRFWLGSPVRAHGQNGA
jgi:hypothetical protein